MASEHSASAIPEQRLWQWLFGVGFILKVLLGSSLASETLSTYFIPFVRYFSENALANPYTKFAISGNYEVFPYPAMMLYLLAIPRFISSFIPGESNFVYELFITRLPLLLADTAILAVLLQWLPKKRIHVTLFYWLSPVLIYITYVHGQLDIIPIALLFFSLYFLFEKRLATSALFLGFALSCKTHIALALPFFLIYIQSQKTFKASARYFCTVILCFLTVNAPFLSSESFRNTVFFNHPQQKIFASFVELNGIVFYFVPAGLLLLLIYGSMLRNFSRDTFLTFLGFAFSIVLLFIPPMQGWYFWLIPFLAYFYTRSDLRGAVLFAGLQASYLAYFLFSPHSDYRTVFQFVLPEFAHGPTVFTLLSAVIAHGGERALGLAFTALQATLLCNCVWIYRRGVEHYRQHKLAAKPYLIGIGGDSGSGKSLLATTLSNVFGQANTSIICGDDLHRWERGHPKWSEFTHLNPKANELHREMYLLRQLKSSQGIVRRQYDHHSGRFVAGEFLKPRNLIIFEGLHPFYIKKLASIYDLKIFIDPEDSLRKHWKTVRDNAERGHTKERVLKQISDRQNDSRSYILTQAETADIIVRPSTKTSISEIGDKAEDVSHFYDLTIDNSFFLEDLVNEMQRIPTLKVDHRYDSYTQNLRIDGDASLQDVAHLAERSLPELKEFGISSLWTPSCLGVLSVTIAYCVLRTLPHDA